MEFRRGGSVPGSLDTRTAVSIFSNLGRHLAGAQHYRDLRISAFSEWSRAVV